MSYYEEQKNKPLQDPPDWFRKPAPQPVIDDGVCPELGERINKVTAKINFITAHVIKNRKNKTVAIQTQFFCDFGANLFDELYELIEIRKLSTRDLQKIAFNEMILVDLNKKVVV